VFMRIHWAGIALIVPLTVFHFCWYVWCLWIPLYVLDVVARRYIVKRNSIREVKDSSEDGTDPKPNALPMAWPWMLWGDGK
jgi:hypothetical protein